jgi:hypothetical protein
MAEKTSINPIRDLPEFTGPLGHKQPRNLDIAAHREEAGRGHPLFRELTAPTGSPAAPGSSIPKQRRPSSSAAMRVEPEPRKAASLRLLSPASCVSW